MQGKIIEERINSIFEFIFIPFLFNLPCTILKIIAKKNALDILFLNKNFANQ
jgi:hypothetical protein